MSVCGEQLLRAAVFAMFLPLASCAAAPVKTIDNFDVPGGHYRKYLDAAIEHDGSVTCQVRAAATTTDPKWGPAVMLVITSNDEQQASQVLYAPGKRFDRFWVATVRGDQYTYRNRFLKLVRRSPDIVLTMGWRRDGLIY